MTKLKIKESYLILLIVVSLVSLGVYTTYALFTASTTLNDVVGITTTLDIGKSMSEYEVVTIQPGETKLIELNIVNSYNDSIYYGAWYKIVQGNSDDIQIGLYTEKNPNPSTGSLASSSNIKLLVGIINDNTTPIVVYLGVKGSLTNELNLGSDKTLLPNDFSEALLVTDEVLEKHKHSKTDTFEKDFEVDKTFSMTGAVQNITLNKGTFKLEAWGAEGGYGYTNATTYAGGKGGYSYGTLTLTAETNLYVYVGGQGNSGTSTSSIKEGGFNGGGASAYYRAGSGGGASDIRIGQDSLYARVIVAGGGGGGAYYSRYYGGAGGGTSGVDGTGRAESTNNAPSKGGTQTAGGAAGFYKTSSTTYAGTAGSFGQGGTGNTTTSGTYSRSGGGGGGWYGGGGGGYRSSSNTYYYGVSGGGGGSGYVYTSSTASNYPSGCLLNSNYYLTNATTIAGDTAFTSPTGAEETGHSGDGAVKITGTETKMVTETVTWYTIPKLTGLSDKIIQIGDSVDLIEGTELVCENNATTGCSIESTSITDTSQLTEGNYVITYTVKGANNKKYLFNRNITIIMSYSYTTLTKLGLTETEKTPDFSKTSCSSGCEEVNVGIYKTEDDFGDSYYFRGDVENNYVYFMGFYWRIIRINGDGTIRMIYDGTSAHDNGESSTDRYISNSTFNSSSNNNAYVGYMYGTVSSTSASYSATHANTTNSNIKGIVDTWYKNNIKGTVGEQYIADAIYCNDRGLSSGSGTSTVETYYNPYNRIQTNKSPTLMCSQNNDRFTTNSSINEIVGNSALTYPVGLITADEVAFAGGKVDTQNSKYYLYTGKAYWTMSPSFYFYQSGAGAAEFRVLTNGSLESNFGGDYGVNNSYGVRPVISLKSDSLNSGSGTKTEPFKINYSKITLTRLGLTETEGTPDFSKTSCSSGCDEATVGIFKAEDDFGDSYYFRGDVENNYVYFAGFYWRIIRINGDGTVRMIYDGTSAHSNGEISTDRQTGTSVFNSSVNRNAYVGYMYGSTSTNSTYAATHKNTNDSTIKAAVDAWYTTNIKGTTNEQYVADAIYCNDRELSSGTGRGTTATNYKAYERLYTNKKTPSLKCTQENDRFTISSSIDGVTGNGALTNPIGLITADEVAYAGGVQGTINSKYYLCIRNYFWTMSPYRFDGSYAIEFLVSGVGSMGGLNTGNVNGGSGVVRPALSLSSRALQYGNGTSSNPFRVNSTI